MLLSYKIKDNIYCIRGMSHSDLDFHGSTIESTDGSSYNTYLIIDKEITLIDTIDEKFTDIFIKELHKILNGRKIDNIIVNHVEPDHSASFTKVKEEFKDTKVYCSKKAIDAMKAMYFKDYDYIEANDLDTINTGKYTFTFVLTPFVHWPDNMVTYLNEEKILFSNDAFGNLNASTNIYDDDFTLDKLIENSKSYYANIIMPVSKFVIKTLDKIKKLNLEFKMICPSHGQILRTYINEIFEKYDTWSNSVTKEKVVIIYETIWGSTEMCTNEITQALVDNNIEVKVFRASKHHASKIITEILDAKAILIGSSNFNSTMVSPLADILERIYASKPQNKIGLAYGSYGWSPTHTKRISERLKEAKLELLDINLIGKYTPDTNRLCNAYDVGKELSKIIKN